MIAGYLLDLDGTVYRGERLITGADQAIETLRKRGRRIVVLSNTPRESSAAHGAQTDPHPPLPQGFDRVVGPRDQPLPPVHRAVEVKEIARYHPVLARG